MKSYNTVIRLAIVLLLLIPFLFAPFAGLRPAKAGTPSGFSEYYVPGSEDNLWAIYTGIDNNPVLDAAQGTHTVVAVTASTDGTRVYYDHWENGYGFDPANPATADETYTLNQGQVKIFESSNIPQPRGTTLNACNNDGAAPASEPCYDGRDRIYTAGGAVTVSRASWPESIGTVFSMAWELYPTKPYLTRYNIPVGQDLYAAPRNYQDFEKVYLLVQATADNTTVTVSNPNPGGSNPTWVINKGESRYLDQIWSGTSVVGDKPIQVQFIAGRYWAGTASDSRGYTAVPSGLWDDEYYNPVGGATGSGTDGRVDLYLFNPNPTSLTIFYQDSAGSGTFSLPAGQTRAYSEMATGRTTGVPIGSAVYLSGDQKFWGIGSAGTESADYNWGYSLVPAGMLKSVYNLGWAPGTSDAVPTNNGSPAYITASRDNTVVYIDYGPADGVPDRILNLDRLTSVKVFDPDNNNTGMNLWASAPIAVVWGEDPDTADLGTPYMDLGYTTLPTPEDWMYPVLTIDKSANPVNIPTGAGQQAAFTLDVRSGDYSITGVNVYDTLPPGWTYVNDSTSITFPDGSQVSGAAANPSIAGQNLTWALNNNMAAGQLLRVVFTGQTTASASSSYSRNKARATGVYGGITFTSVDDALVYPTGLKLSKTSSATSALSPGDVITYTVRLDNTGAIMQNDILIQDALPAGTSYVAGSSQVQGYRFSSTSPQTLRDDFNVQSYTNNNGSRTWLSAWSETDPGGNGAVGGNLSIPIPAAYLQLNGAGGLPANLQRSMNLSAATSATLSFQYNTSGTGFTASDILRVSISNDGGVNWYTLARYTGAQASATASLDIGAYTSANTVLRYEIESGYGGTRYFRMDYVQVAYNEIGALTPVSAAGGAPPDLTTTANGYALAPGNSMVVSYRVKVNNPLPAGMTAVVNTARATSNQQPEPLTSTTVNPVNIGAIGNRLWVDENSDGVQDPGEPGIGGVTVELYDSGANLLGSTITDPDGGYEFSGVGAGAYSVRVKTSSLPAALNNPTYDEDGGVASPNSQAAVTLSAGQSHNSADFGYNWAPSANVNTNTGTGAIGDRLWSDANGNGRQDPGEPGLGGVKVRLYSDPDGDGLYTTNAMTVTSAADGSFAFTGLAAGAYVIQVNGGSAPTGYTQTGDPDQPFTACTACDQVTTWPVILAPGDVFLNVDFGYQPSGPSGAIGDRVWFNPNGNGTLDTPSGEYGLAGVSVALIRDTNGDGKWAPLGADGLQGTADDEPIIASDLTDAQGTYGFSGLPLDNGMGNASYLVWANDTNRALSGLVPNYDADGLSQPASGSVTANLSAVTLASASPTNIASDFGYAPLQQVDVTRAGVIGDTVFLDRDSSGAYNAGEGLEGVTVRLYNSGGTLLLTTRTDRNGNYSFGGLAAGTYSVRVDATTLPNGGAGLGNSLDPDGGSANQSAVSLASGQINLAQDFGYTAAAPGQISGVLWEDANADGALAASEANRFGGVTLALLDSTGRIVASTTTAANGSYSFGGLPAGAYKVQVTDQDKLLLGAWHSLGADSQADPYTVSLSAGGSASASFGYTRRLAAVGNFTWVDTNENGLQDAGEPGLAGVKLTLTVTYPNGAVVNQSTVSDSSGTYSFGYLLADEDFDGVGGGEPTYSLTYTTPAVNYTPTLANQGSDDTLDSDSPNTAFTLTKAAANDTFDFGFQRLVAIGDSVWLDSDGDGAQSAGEPGLAGVVVELKNSACTLGVNCPTAATNSSGNYAFNNLPKGSYTVVVRSASLPGGAVQTGDPDGVLDSQHSLAASTGGDYLYVDFGYRGSGAIGDRVWNDVDGDGVQEAGEAGIPGVRVYLDANGNNSFDSGETFATTDASGAYQIGSLLYGAYSLRAEAPAGATQTYDFTPPTTDNEASLTLNAGNPSDLRADFGYRYAALNISKTSSAGGAVNPGDTINYQIVVGNNSGATQTGIAITDTLPAGTSYVSGSASGYVFTPYEYRDDFNTANYGLSTGATLWPAASPWTENNDDGSPAGGVIYITGGELLLDGSAARNTSIQRDIPGNLGGQTVTLELDYREINNMEADDGFYVSIWDGATWHDVVSILNDFGDPAAQIIDISSYVNPSGTTRIRIASTADNENIYVSYVRLSYTSVTSVSNAAINPPPYLIRSASGYGLLNGQSMTVNLQVKVDNPLSEALASIDNTAQVVSAQSPTPRSSSTSDLLPSALVGDRAWLDVDGDGVQDAGEPGLANLRLRLYRDNGDSSFNPASDTLVSTTYSDSAGGYLFRRLPPGNYFVDVDGGAPPGLSLSPGATSPTTLINLAAGGSYLKADFGYTNTSATTAVIGDRIWSDADGDGLQDPGEPGLAGVTVQLLQNGTMIQVATTGLDGAYWFTNLAPGQYTVDVTDAGGRLTGYTLSSGPQSNPDPTAPLTAAAGELYERADFGYRPPAAQTNTIGDLLWYDANKDGQKQAGEAGLAGISAALITDANGDGAWDPDGLDNSLGTADDEVIVATAISDASGGYLFSGVPDGRYLVWVSDSAGRLQNTIQTYDPDTPAALPCSACNNLGAVNADAAGSQSNGSFLGLDFAYLRPGSLGDTLFSDANGNGLQDPGEPGISGVSVQLWRDADSNGAFDQTLDTLVASQVSGAGGRNAGEYLFTGLPAGTYFASVGSGQAALASYTLTTADQQSGANAPGAQLTVSLTAGGSNLGADFGYRKNSLYEIGDLAWNDLNGDGTYDPASGETGLAGLSLALYKDLNHNGIIEAGEPLMATTSTGAGGAYSFYDLPDWYTADQTKPDYIVAVTDQNGAVNGYQQTAGLQPWGVALNGASLANIDFGFVRYPATGAIGSLVWYDLNGDGLRDATEDGIAGVAVKLYRDADNNGSFETTAGATTTDGRGEYSFRDLPAGRYQAQVDGANFNAGQALNSTVSTSGGDARGPIPLAEGGQYNLANFGYRSSSGSLGDTIWSDADADGRQDPGEPGIGGVTVELYQNGALVQTTTSKPDGQYHFTGLSYGTYTVSIPAANFASGGALYNYTYTAGLQSMSGNSSPAIALEASTPRAADVDFGYVNASRGAIGDTIWLDKNLNGAQDGTEAGLAGVTLDLIRDSNNDGAWDPDGLDNIPGSADDEPVVATTQTDLSGGYAFTGLQLNASYLVYVHDNTGILQGLALVGASPCGSNPCAATVTSGAPSLSNRDFGYDDPDLGDLIWHDANHNGLQEGGESGIQGVLVELYHDLDSDGVIDPGQDDLMKTSLTDANGQYFLAGLPFQSYIIKVPDSNFAPGAALEGFSRSLQSQGGNSELDSNLDAANQMAITPLGPKNFSLDGGFYAASGYSIGDRIWLDNGDGLRQDTNPTELGIAGVTVALVRDLNGNGQLDPADTLLGQASTDSNGQYGFTNIPNGKYILQVNDRSGVLVDFVWTYGGAPNGVQDISQPGSLAVTLSGANFANADSGYSLPPNNPNDPYHPTGITLVNFAAIPGQGQTTITWQTMFEIDTLGFNLYRATSLDGERALLNAELIAAQPGGGAYQWVDPGTQYNLTYYYWLEEISSSGKTIYGPVSTTQYGNFLPTVCR